MKIDPAKIADTGGKITKRSAGEKEITISTDDKFTSTGNTDKPGIIDRKTAASVVLARTKMRNYKVLWSFKPEKKKYIRKENPDTRKAYEQLYEQTGDKKALQDYLDSIGKPYFNESRVSTTPAPAKDGKGLIIATNNKDMYCVGEDGKPVWKKEISNEDYVNIGKVCQSPTCDILFKMKGDLHRLDPDTMKVEPFKSIEERQGSFYSVGSDGTIYQGTRDKKRQNCVYALNPDDTVKWRFHTPGNAIKGKPVEGPDGKVCFHTWNGEIFVISADGKKSAHTKLEGKTASWNPVFSPDGERVYMGLKDGSVASISAKDGSTEWIKSMGMETGEQHMSVGNDGTLYVAGLKGKLVAFDPDGREKWEYRSSGDMMTCPIVSKSGDVYQVSGDESLHCIDNRGVAKWIAKITAQYAPPPYVDDDDTLYVVTKSGCLQAIKSSTIEEIAERAAEGQEGEGKSVPTIEIGEGFVTIGGVKLSIKGR
ncbi:MAG: PQQ-binding-like beta-propeller repeat protein [Candidatus Eremiobacteraeota bacterium]|nr:PQQ-binding-like beta-propeller repeat protein [Candidatus Eremiobacteraeota bacterium]